MFRQSCKILCERGEDGDGEGISLVPKFLRAAKS